MAYLVPQFQFWRPIAPAVAVLLCALAAYAAEPTTLTEADWALVSYTPFSDMQAVDGTGAYQWSVPTLNLPEYDPDYPQAYKLRGVVLNDPTKMLDNTADYNEGDLMYMGGQWQVYIQAVSLPGDATEHQQLVGDLGGAALWMGQNYGNHYRHLGDYTYNYTNEEWDAEVARLNYPIDAITGQLVTEPLRVGDLIEVRARGGLHYGGKFNCNEQHTNDPIRDFQIIVLDRDVAIETEAFSLSDVVNTDGSHIFDSTRATGGEYYQARAVTLEDVTISAATAWETYGVVEVTDGTRVFNVKLGHNEAFDLASLPTGSLDITGIFDQDGSSTGDYRMWALSPSDFAPATSLLPGDANADNQVDEADAARLAEHWGATEDASWFDGDFNGDGQVDLADASILAANWGTVAAEAIVPEPAGLVLLLAATAAMLFGRRLPGRS